MLAWADVTGSVGLFGEGPAIANDIRGRIRQELGLTVSIGVSFNKVFAKLGSDMKKPDATTVITPENYRDKARRLPVRAVGCPGYPPILWNKGSFAPGVWPPHFRIGP